MTKLKIIKKDVSVKCFRCEGKGCKHCNKGKYIEFHYYHIYKNKNNKLYCFDGDSIK